MPPQPLSIIRLRKDGSSSEHNFGTTKSNWSIGSMDIIIAFARSHLKNHDGGNFKNMFPIVDRHFIKNIRKNRIPYQILQCPIYHYYYSSECVDYCSIDNEQ